MASERLSREARRNLILDAATEVFGRLGFEATRMDDVAKAAGIAKGLVYKHFPSKDALFEALIDRQGRAAAAELRGALGASDVAGHPFEALRSGLELWLRSIGDKRGAFSFTDPGAHDAYASLRTQMRAVIAESVRAAEPSLEAPYAWLVAALIQGAAENLGLAWRAEPGPVSEEEALGMLAGFCWGGLMQLRAWNGEVPTV
jgi:AcrR family transcriptional regulator